MAIDIKIYTHENVNRQRFSWDEKAGKRRPRHQDRESLPRLSTEISIDNRGYRVVTRSYQVGRTRVHT